MLSLHSILATAALVGYSNAWIVQLWQTQNSCGLPENSVPDNERTGSGTTCSNLGIVELHALKVIDWDDGCTVNIVDYKTGCSSNPNPDDIRDAILVSYAKGERPSGADGSTCINNMDVPIDGFVDLYYHCA